MDIHTRTTDFDAALVLPIVPLVRYVSYLQIVTALLEIHEDVVIRRQRTILDRGVVVIVVRVGQPKTRYVLLWRLESTLQLHRRTLVRVHLRLLDSALRQSCNRRSCEFNYRRTFPKTYSKQHFLLFPLS